MLSREQNAMFQYKMHSVPLQEAINDTKLEPLIALNNILIDAVSWFGISEHYARQAERSALIKDSARAKQCQLSLERHNQTGLHVLSRAQAHMESLSSEFGKGRPSGKDKEAETMVTRPLEDLKTIIADFEIKPSDARKLGDAIDQVGKAFNEAGHGGVVKLVQTKISELREVRSRPDRGAVENIPIWKAIAIIAAIGIWVIGVIHCGWFRCSVDWAKAYAIGFNVAAAIAYFC